MPIPCSTGLRAMRWRKRPEGALYTWNENTGFGRCFQIHHMIFSILDDGLAII